MSCGAAALLMDWIGWQQAGAQAVEAVRGFDLVAWIAPLAVFAAALLGTILLVRRWSAGKPQPKAQGSDPARDALKEKLRRETGSDGGF